MHRSTDILDPAIMGNETTMHALFDHLRDNDPVFILIILIMSPSGY